MKLYEISEEFAPIIAELESTEMDDEAISELLTVLEDIQATFDEKAETVALFIKDLRADATAIKAEEDKLKARRETIERKVNYMTAYLTDCMRAAQRPKFSTPRCSVSLRKNAPSVRIDDEQAFVWMLQRNGRDDLLKYPKPEIRKKEVKELLQNGEHLDGAQLIQGSSLVIK